MLTCVSVSSRCLANPQERAEAAGHNRPKGSERGRIVDGKLVGDIALKAQLDAVVAGAAASKESLAWYEELTRFIDKIRGRGPHDLRDESFLLELWDKNPVSAVGMGSVKVAPAVANPAFRTWFADWAAKPLPEDSVAVQARLVAFYDDLRDRMKALCGRVPALKINRVLCALYPGHFTTIADTGKLQILSRAMGGSPSDHPVYAHAFVLKRIGSLIGDVDASDTAALVRRICLPWFVYERTQDDAVPEDAATSFERFKPVPAALRLRGLMAMGMDFQTIVGFLPTLQEGASRDEVEDLIRQWRPGLSASAIKAYVNTLARGFGLFKRDGDTFTLSARGINLLESRDPDVFQDLLLTKVLGMDHVVKALDAGPMARSELVALLQRANPGWTGDYGPAAQLGWLRTFDVIEPREDRKSFRLTERGRRWVEHITWTPECLRKEPETIDDIQADSVRTDSLQLPMFPELAARLAELTAGRLNFERALVAQLHAALWFHPVRHFAVLTGISGSGKTQLALHYALALCGAASMADTNRVKIISVQPGWYDPAPLLGYVNPLQEASYRSAAFLQLVQRAAADPERPYVAILDEMNLSHPEQYLAPVLSAMETQGSLDLHDLAKGVTEVPPSIRYPANLALIGTLNMDETTHGLSDKVLDRAYTLEFWNIDVARFPGWSTSNLRPELLETARVVLAGLIDALAPVRLHFGWRTIDDVLGLLAFHAQLDTGVGALDDVIYAKVLPKLRGELSAKFQRALADTEKVLHDHGLARCKDKVKSLQEDLALTGSCRFWR